MVVCAIAGCDNTYGRDKVTFSRIPKANLRLYYAYLKRADIDKKTFMEPGITGYTKYRICSAHFSPDSYFTDKQGRQVLKPDALPIPPKSIEVKPTRPRRFCRGASLTDSASDVSAPRSLTASYTGNTSGASAVQSQTATQTESTSDAGSLFPLRPPVS